MSRESASWGSRREFLRLGMLGTAAMLPAMIPSSGGTGVELTAKRTGSQVPLIPEEAALFQVAMTNGGAVAATVDALDGPLSDPVVRVLDSKGKLLGSYTPADKATRYLGDLHGLLPPAPEPVELQPGARETWWANLWGYRDPLPPGGYQFQAEHQLSERGPWARTPLEPFHIVNARIGDFALGYTNAEHEVSTLVWAGTPEDGSGPERILVRNSSVHSHAVLGDGATTLPGATAGARFSVGQAAADALPEVLKWIAAATAKGLRILQHTDTELHWESPPVALGLAHPLPVPRFPDRGHAVYMATGQGTRGPELVGVKVVPGSQPPAVWRVPLMHNPEMAAVWFGTQGPIVVFLVSLVGAASVVSMLTVNEDGRVLLPEMAIRSSAARALAIAVDMRPGAPPKFLMLEEDLQAHGRVALVHIPVAGRIDAAPPAALPGWPARFEGEGESRISIPLASREVALEVAADGAPWVALTDERDHLYGGSLIDFQLKLLRGGELPGEPKRTAIHPHVGALRGSTTLSCFTETGELFHYVAKKYGGH